MPTYGVVDCKYTVNLSSTQLGYRIFGRLMELDTHLFLMDRTRSVQYAY